MWNACERGFDIFLDNWNYSLGMPGYHILSYTSMYMVDTTCDCDAHSVGFFSSPLIKWSVVTSLFIADSSGLFIW